MAAPRALLVAAMVALLGSSACGGCGAPPPGEPVERHAESTASSPPLIYGESLVLVTDGSRLALAGEMDRENRYPSTVLIYSRVQAQLKRCSGVVIDRRLVLTAGHCVCPQRAATLSTGQAGFLIDSSGCATTASVKTVSYTPAKGIEDTANSTSNIYSGPVELAPGFLVQLDERDRVESSVSDLAVIILRRPIEEKITPVGLADTEAHPLESILIAGQSYDEVEDSYDEDRRVSKNTVTRAPLPQDLRLLVRQPEGHLYKGDSGGPCLREQAGSEVLVGVSSRKLGEGAACTSIHANLRWLRDKLLSSRAIKDK